VENEEEEEEKDILQRTKTRPRTAAAVLFGSSGGLLTASVTASTIMEDITARSQVYV
jgi:hypothetical protein